MSEMATRVAVATVGIPVIVFPALIGGYPFYLLVLVIASVALIEFYLLSQRKGALPLKTFGVIAGMCVLSTFFYAELSESITSSMYELFPNVRMPSQGQMLLIILIIFVLLTLLIELFRGKPFPFLNIGMTISGVLYLSLSFGTLVGIRELFGEEILSERLLAHLNETSMESARDVAYRWGGYTVISIFACIWICDTAAQFVGLRFGRHKLLERVSPKKTWEGALAGFIAAILTALLSKHLVLPFLSTAEAVVVGFVVGVFGQLGDLAESLLKRDAGVKDSSQILPGHGGVLDRFDSLLFVSPILFVYFDLVLF